MTAACRTTLTLVAVFGALLAGAPSHAGTARGYVDGMIVVGGQVFPGGTIEVQAVGRGELLAIRLDGRQIALAFRDPRGATLASGRGSLVLHRDARGLHHIEGLRSAASSSCVGLRVAAVSRGIAALPPGAAADGEGFACAPR